jgi:hypothetical protein
MFGVSERESVRQVFAQARLLNSHKSARIARLVEQIANGGWRFD